MDSLSFVGYRFSKFLLLKMNHELKSWRSIYILKRSADKNHRHSESLYFSISISSVFVSIWPDKNICMLWNKNNNITWHHIFKRISHFIYIEDNLRYWIEGLYICLLKAYAILSFYLFIANYSLFIIFPTKIVSFLYDLLDVLGP